MSLGLRSSLIALATAGILTGAAFAAVADDAHAMLNCHKLSQQADDALKTSAESKNIDAARLEDLAGHRYCENGVYEQGVKHFAKTLQLLSPG